MPPKKRAIASSTASPRAPTIPNPFRAAPADLAPFYHVLDPSKVYITHVDRHPAGFKKQIFLVPVFLNLAITVLLLWRAYVILPYYLALTTSALGRPNEHTISYKTTATSKLVWVIGRRALTFGIDWLLIRTVGPWPYGFFLEQPGNPVLWRWKLRGFRDQEIIVRESRTWGASELLESTSVKQNNDAEASPFFKVRIVPAVAREYIRGKSGYMMMDKDWDLDFAAMVRAEECVATDKITRVRFEKCVWLCVNGKQVSDHEDVEPQWARWECWGLDQNSNEAEARKKILQFRDKLSDMGKEGLFFKWVEMIHYESSQPGGFTRQKQQEAVNKAKALFQEEGVDFEEFAKSVGGIDAVQELEEAEKDM